MIFFSRSYDALPSSYHPSCSRFCCRSLSFSKWFLHTRLTILHETAIRYGCTFGHAAGVTGSKFTMTDKLNTLVSANISFDFCCSYGCRADCWVPNNSSALLWGPALLGGGLHAHGGGPQAHTHRQAGHPILGGGSAFHDEA